MSLDSIREEDNTKDTAHRVQDESATPVPVLNLLDDDVIVRHLTEEERSLAQEEEKLDERLRHVRVHPSIHVVYDTL